MFRIGSIFIPVTNIEESTIWYEKALGAKKIDSWGEGIGLYLPSGLTQLALIKVSSPQPTEFATQDDQKNAYYNFVVDDIEAAYQHLKNHGVTTSEICDFGGMLCFDFKDLDGNPFSVVNEVEGSPYHSDHVKFMQEIDQNKE